jgi:predicted ATPase/tRNA A-37 threonylcarbamoyl transferase component Bud32
MPETGASLNQYRLDHCIDQGGMGEVFRAFDTRLKRRVAIKFLRDDAAPLAARRFLREARAASALNHPNIVIIHEVGEFDGAAPFIVQELIEGRTLRSLLDDPLPIHDVVEIGRQVARALGAAHEAGVTHRDVKPENIMRREDGLVKVLDFGVAHLAEGSASAVTATDHSYFATEAGLVVGTPSYMSPEHAGGGTAGPPGDIFSLGIVLYEMLAGRPPFTGPAPLSIIAAILTAHPPPLGSVRPDAPRALTDLVHRMLDKDPARRPTARDVEVMLAPVSAGPMMEPLPPDVAPRPATVGREKQRDHLLRSYVRARDGSGRIVAVTGEPGIGKSTLLDEFISELGARGERPIILRGHCSESLAGTEAYLPILEALDHLRQPATGESFDGVIRSVAPTWYTQVATIARDGLPLASGDAGPAPSQERMKRELGMLLEEVSRARPVVFIIDDLHWADISTIDMLNYLAGRFSAMRLLVLTGYRPSDMALSEHPFLAIRTELQSRGLFEEVPLDFLRPDDVAAYLALQFPDHAFPAEFADVIYRRTDGSPLFMADLVRYLHDTGDIVEEAGAWRLGGDAPLSADALPATVRAMITRKIEQVDAQDRRLLEAASVQGREFDSTVVGEALEMDVLEVEDRLERLERVHVFLRQKEEAEFPDRALTLRYQFVHVLYQNELYQALRPTRRVALAGRIARALASHHGADTTAVAGRLAVLFETAREFATSAQYFFIAAQRAIDLFGHREALSLAERGLKGVASLPADADRHQLELGLQLLRGTAQRVVMGWAAPELERTFARARELCQLLQDPAELFPVLWNLAFFHMIRGDLRVARDQTATLMAQAEASSNPPFLVAAHHLAGVTCEFLGNLVESSEHLEHARELHDPAQHHTYTAMFGPDPGMIARAMSSRPLWSLGYPDRSLERSRETIALVRSQRHPVTLVFALVVGQGVHVYRGEASEAIALGDEIIRLCDEYEFPQEAEWARGFQGAALALQGQPDDGVVRLQQSLAALQALGSGLVRTMFLSLLADAAHRAGRIDDGIAAVDEGVRHAEGTLEGGFIAELHRTRGELLMLAGDRDGAERSLRAALTHARGQQARSFELRAATALARFLLADGRGAEARAELTPVHDWFTEGHDTSDLRAAASLLDTIG